MLDGETQYAMLNRFARRLLRTGRGVKRSLAMLIDALSSLAAVWLSFVLRLGAWLGSEQPMVLFALTVVPSTIAIFAASGMYNNVFRFHGPRSVAQLGRSCAILALMNIAVFGYIGVSGIPRTISVIYPLILFSLVALNRIVAKFFLVDLFAPRRGGSRVLIYGAGRAGRQLATSLQQDGGYDLVAYVDDDPAMVGQRLEGVPILSFVEAEAMLENRELDLVLLAMPTLRRSERRAIVERLQPFDVHVQTLPSITELVSGEVSISDVREVQVADLLSRDQVLPDKLLMGSTITDKTVLVTGAGGSIGGELARQVISLKPRRLVLFEMSEASLFSIEQDIRALCSSLNSNTHVVAELGSLASAPTVNRLFERWRPQTVFHAAAYKHVPLVEANVVAGVQNNVEGTLNSALAACASEVERFVLVSTDKAVRPTNVMGASKRVCELILQALSADRTDGPIFSMVRFGNVLGSSGSVVPQFQSQIAKGGPVTLTHRDITRYFMTIPEAAELVIQAGAMAKGGEVFLLDMGEPVCIYDLARSLIQMCGRTVKDADNPDGDIEIVEVGLRPGEKLYEELLIGAEAMRTSHERIFCANEEMLSWKALREALIELQESARVGDHVAIKALLAQLVHGYEDNRQTLHESRR